MQSTVSERENGVIYMKPLQPKFVMCQQNRHAQTERKYGQIIYLLSVGLLSVTFLKLGCIWKLKAVYSAYWSISSIPFTCQWSTALGSMLCFANIGTSPCTSILYTSRSINENWHTICSMFLFIYFLSLDQWG